MNCPACAHPNRPGAKFCEECAAPLPRACASCGAELRASAKFCDECGTSVAARAASAARAGATASEARSEAESAKPSEDQRGSRKIVTIIFADLVGSTALHERLDPESVRRFMESYYAAMRGAVEAHGGRVTQVMGDGVKAVFGAPRVAEDDALRAVRAGVEMQRAFRELAERESALVGQTGLRVAVNTGEVVADDATEIIGDPVNVAARLQEKGRDGDVVIGGETQRIVATRVTLALLGSFALKGRSEPVKAYRVESLEPPARETTAAFVGREAELARLTAAYETALAKPATQLAVLLGSPGLGKSRLIEEFARRIGDAANAMSAHCDAAGGATFAPLARALREGLGIEAAASGEALRSALEAALPVAETERARIANGIAALLGGSPASPEETFFVVRRLLGALAAQKPVLLVIDDLHWAEPLLLDLVEHLVQWGSGTRLLVLVGARPELRDARSSLATPGGLVADVITLAGLDAGAATRLAANVIGAADLPAAIAAKLLITSEGNPLFVGELVRMLVEEGALRREGERWVASAELAALEMPPTIHALLAARIERLRPEERGVLERAAVVGRHFSRSAVAALLSPREAIELDARLEALRRSELIERDTGWWLGEPALRFHHVLIRDAAYRRVLKGTRAELHARLADWIEARAGESTEHDETIGWHLEQAHEHLRELGPLDARGVLLGTRAAQRLAAAGRRALARDDLALAGSLLQRALERLDPADASRADLALDCSEALLASGEVGPAAAVIEELGRLAGDSERLGAWHTCFAGQLTALTEPSALNAAAERVAAAADALARLGDAAGEAKAHHVHAQALARLGRVGAAEAALDRALAAARRAGDRRRANAVLAGAPLAALWGPSPVTRASGRCLDVVRVLRITQDAPAVEAVALSCQGVLEALRGRTDAARRMVASARKLLEELGITQRVLEVDGIAARIDLLDGDAASAERLLRGATDGLRALGLGIDAARAAALLGRALLAQGRAAEAEALSHESEALAGDDLQAAIAWRGVRAEALAQRGEHAAAIALAQAAVGIASATDALLDHADARLALATVLRAAGRNNEASAEEKRAIELWEAKGATLLAERVRGEAQREASAARFPSTAASAALATATDVRRIRGNAAASVLKQLDAAFAAGSLEAQVGLLHEAFEEIDHVTGSRNGLAEWRWGTEMLLGASGVSVWHEILAALDASCVLARRSIRATGGARDGLDVGPFDDEKFVVASIDATSRLSAQELFGATHLGDAIARLYARYAELLPEGAERTRAEATARSLAVLLAPPDLDRIASAIAAGVDTIDHQVLGYGPAHGREVILRAIRVQLETADRIAPTVDDLLRLEASALLVRRTVHGTLRAGGGVYEKAMISLYLSGRDGLVERWEQFGADDEAAALARFDALTGAAESAHPPARRVRANAGTRCIDHFCAAIAARDATALAPLCDDTLRVVHHTTRAEYGRRELLGTWRSILRAERLGFRTETIASLGDSLALERHWLSIEGLAEEHVAGFGHSEFDELVLFHVNESGRLIHMEIFAGSKLSHALSRLYERHAGSLLAGPERARADAIARSASVMLGQPDLAATATVLAPAVEFSDLRTVGFGTLRGAETVIDTIAAMMKLSSDDAAHIDDVLALETDALAVRWTNEGTDRATGGVFERKLCQLFTFGEGGLVARWQQFEVEDDAEALARFDELTARGAPAEPFANAASRSVEREIRAFAAHDWEGVVALFSPTVRFHDRRRMMHLEVGYEAVLAQERLLFDQPTSRWHEPLLATRGERLSLHRCRFEAEVAGGGGPLAIDDHLVLVEVDAEGRLIATVLFDPEDQDAAYAQLDARYEAGEASPYTNVVRANRAFRTALASRDWDAVLATCAPDLVCHNHRVLGWDTLHGAAAWVQLLQTTAQLSPDYRPRVDHTRICENGVLMHGQLHGTRDGGEFEIPFVRVNEIGPSGRVVRIDLFDHEQRAEALARFEELRATPAKLGEPFANAASRALREFARAWSARDWAAVRATYHDAHRMDDRRKLMRLGVAGDAFFKNERVLFDGPPSEWRAELLATRGERLALFRVRFTAQASDSGPAEVEMLDLIEVNAAGERTALVVFEVEDIDAAYAELDARFAAGESAWMPAFVRVVGRRDWEALAELCAPSLIAEDHRLVSWGTLRGLAEYVPALRSMVDLAPDAQLRLDHLRTSGRAELFEAKWLGTRDGGAFEIPILGAHELDERGRQLHFDLYDPHQLDRARARFDEIVASAPAPPPTRFENAATRAADEMLSCWSQRDWQRFARLLSEGLRYEDRRQLVRLDLGREQYLTFIRQLGDLGSSRFELEVLATRGDRLALMRSRNEAAEGDVGPSEIESLLILETGARGEIASFVRFDRDELDAAYAELDARYQADEAATQPHGPAAPLAFPAAVMRRDWDAALAACAPDMVCHDHRLLGWGTLHGAEAWIQMQRVLAELAPDFHMRTDHHRTCERGVLHESMTFGTRDGGAFERAVIGVNELNAAGKLQRIDLYDPDQLDQARARFEEIRARSASTPAPARFENTASRAWREVMAAWRARDVARFARLHDALVRYRDDRRLFQLDLDREQFIEFSRPLLEMRSGSASLELLATRGDRLALKRQTIEMADDTVGPSAIDSLILIETNPAGAITEYRRWDVNDLDAAHAELNVRFAAGEGAANERVRTWLRKFGPALISRDWSAAADCFAPSFVGHDHRLVGWDTLRGNNGFLASVRSMAELAPDVRSRIHHMRESGPVLLLDATWFGTREGGAFESSFIVALEMDGEGRALRGDFYDSHQADRALARFEELGRSAARDPLAIPPNEATRTWDRWYAAMLEGDDERVLAFHADSFQSEDRRRLLGVEHGREAEVRNAQWFREGGFRAVRTLLATAGDRLALQRVVWTTRASGAASEIEQLEIDEMDAEGRCVAIVLFDPDARAAASAELFERYVRLGADGMPASQVEVMRAIAARDPARLRAALPDSYFVDDHRRLGLGRLERDAYVASFTAMNELARELRIDELYQVAVAPSLRLAVSRMYGINAEGGEFETFAVWLGRYENGRPASSEYFDLEDLDAARARFDELGRGDSPGVRDPLRIPPNAATRARKRWRAALDARDWAAVRAQVGGDFTWEDRGKRALVSGGIETWIASMQFNTSLPGFRYEIETIATFGDRVAVESLRWRGGTAESDAVELPRLRVLEADASGAVRAMILFDSDDRAAAFEEAEARFAAGEAAAVAGQAAIAAFTRSFAREDWPALREFLTAGFELHDLRTLGHGALSRDAWVDSMRTLARPGSGVRVEHLQLLAWNRHGRVVVARTAGLDESAGEFEILAISLFVTESDRVARLERYDLADAERALARFEALCAEREKRGA